MRYLLISLLVMLSWEQVAYGGDVIVTVRSLDDAALERVFPDLVQEIATQGYYEATDIELFFIIEALLDSHPVVKVPRHSMVVGEKKQLGFFVEGRQTDVLELGIQRADEEGFLVSLGDQQYRIGPGGACLIYQPQFSTHRVVVIRPLLEHSSDAVD